MAHLLQTKARTQPDPKIREQQLELAEVHRKLALKASEQIAAKKAKPTE